MFGHVLHWHTVCTLSGALAPDRCKVLSRAKFTLRPSLALSCIGSVTARHSSSGRQPNFAALSRGRHLYSAGRPSRWTLAHILVLFFTHSVDCYHISRSCIKSFIRPIMYCHKRRRDGILLRLPTLVRRPTYSYESKVTRILSN